MDPYPKRMHYRINPQWFIAPLIGGGLLWFISRNFALGVAVFAGLLMPGFIRLYIPYAKDNPRHVWFKRKLYGWGWTPVTWQGWLITIGYVGLVAAFAITINENSPLREIVFTFGLPTFLLTLAFMRIAYVKGEKPRWQWGVDRS